MRTLSRNLWKASYSGSLNRDSLSRDSLNRGSQHRPAQGHLLGQDGHRLPSAPPPMADWTYRAAALAAALLLLATAGGAL